MTPDRFPPILAAGWALPKPDGFLAHFRPLIHPRATFSQPMFPDARGIDQIETMFRRLFTLFPDMTLAIAHTAANEDTVYVESLCTATLGRRPVTFTVCDRFTIVDGTIRARHSYSDPLPVLLACLRSPATWPRLLRSRLPVRSA
ncbi:nuclear transport factor 2 family protein [Actinomadura verrucosospora]|uniref:SnoaL-like domain-containing protein n=1 Tax=Actinomadura verrucosospora TaxID=46165 RepID=A0A7D3VVL2_ACTVE|nr:nuclear transport factor 2 family protein [Actinomadura verrucosospora]QKG24555.1 SnoaL-like domain-containing protein [Actinomadura verrucosospora]